MLPTRLLLLLIFLPALTASATSWGDSVSGDLHWGQSLHLDEYRLEAADFSADSSRPAVLLKLYKGDEMLIQRPLRQGENLSFNDTITAEVENISIPDRSDGGDETVAKVKLGFYAAPNIQLHITSDKDTYEPGEDVSLSLIAENQGIEDAEGIRIKISSQPELLNLNYGISELKAGQSLAVGDGDIEKKIRLKAPGSLGPSEFRVLAKAEYSNKADKDYEATGYGIFDVTGQLIFHKQTEATMVPGKVYPVILTLRNLGEDNITVDLTDSIADGFHTNSSLKWKVGVAPGKTEIVSYNVRPESPGVGLILPAATATYELDGKRYESKSESPSVDIAGPYLAVEKRISPSTIKPGDVAEVYIDVENKGNLTVKASLNESIPGWARQVGGQTSMSQLLTAGDKFSLSYALTGDKPGMYEIPETMVSYADAKGEFFSVNSSSLQLEILEEKHLVNAINATLSNTTSNMANTTLMGNDTIEHGALASDSRLSDVPVYIWALAIVILAFIYALLGKIL